jgi:hypothetical protein
MNVICQLVVTLVLALGARDLEARAAAVDCAAPPAATTAAPEGCCEPCPAFCRWLCELLGCRPEPCPPKGCCQSGC